MWECLIPTTTPSFLDIANCVFTIAFGDMIFTSIIFVAIFAYVGWKKNLPMQAMLPMGIVMIALLTVTTTTGTLDWLFWSGIIIIFILFALGLAKRLKIL